MHKIKEALFGMELIKLEGKEVWLKVFVLTNGSNKTGHRHGHKYTTITLLWVQPFKGSSYYYDESWKKYWKKRDSFEKKLKTTKMLLQMGKKKTSQVPVWPKRWNMASQILC